MRQTRKLVLKEAIGVMKAATSAQASSIFSQSYQPPCGVYYHET